MIQEHPVHPSRNLIQQWLGDYFGCPVSGEISDSELYLATQAARWGADMELEACCVWLRGNDPYEHDYHQMLRAARRPKPPSLKERALQAWAAVEAGTDDQTAMAVIRRALEALPE